MAFALMRAAGAAVVLLSASLAAAQAPDPAQPAAPQGAQEQAQPAPSPDSSEPRVRPGLVDAFGRMIRSGLGAWSTGLKSARDTIGGFGGQAGTAAKDAADSAGDVAKGAAAAAGSVARLPVSGVVSGREKCAVAANGAPDCAFAAETMCKASGYSTGRSIDFQTADKCSGRLLAAGPKPAEITCRPEHFVVKALCQ